MVLSRYLICSLILALSANLVLANPDQNQSKLSALSTEIHSLQKDIAEDRDSQQNLQNHLRETELKMAHLSTSLSDLEHEMTTIEKNIDKLNDKIAVLQNQLSSEESSLSREMRHAYQFGQNSAIKLMLNTETPNDLDRMMHYFRLLNEQKIIAMTEIKKNIDHLMALQKELQEREIQLKNIQAQEKALIQDMIQQQAARQTLMGAIQQSLNDKNNQLTILEQNHHSLENLIRSLKQQNFNLAAPPLSFAKLQGHLPWPLSGRITDHFGDSIENSNLQCSGVLLDTPTGTAVHVIYPGRVIFADWLKGFGLLVIVDHGQNYMSLYARNNALTVKTGDSVRWGQVIAKAGSTGGYGKTALYFEIRHNGEPVNPERWCGQG